MNEGPEVQVLPELGRRNRSETQSADREGSAERSVVATSRADEQKSDMGQCRAGRRCSRQEAGTTRTSSLSQHSEPLDSDPHVQQGGKEVVRATLRLSIPMTSMGLTFGGPFSFFKVSKPNLSFERGSPWRMWFLLQCEGRPRQVGLKQAHADCTAPCNAMCNLCRQVSLDRLYRYTQLRRVAYFPSSHSLLRRTS